MRKIFSLLILLMYILWCIIGIVGPTVTNSSAAPWTRERALHLARSTLFDPDPGMVDILFAAGSASAAVDLLFPDAIGPDRSAYESALTAYTSSGFNWSDQNHAARLYQMKYVLDPYEAKRKLFSLFEDIYSVNVNGSLITYKDGVDQHDLIYSLMFGNYQIFVKRLLYNNGNPGDYAQGESLNLLNQIDPKNPNENYARELMQLFMMGEYEPFESAEKGDPRNYEESDIRSLARILTGYRSDTMTHAVTLDTKYHYGGNVSYLPGDLPDGVSFPFYSTLT